MGIRFLCPNGHKLNVKSFLAGKRGICPECDARFLIPLESGGQVIPVDEEPAAPASQAMPSVAPADSGSTERGFPRAESAVEQEPVSWHVRSSSGIQQGPLSRVQLQGMIDAGQVDRDCWLWRTGWADWQRASDAFPQLGVGETVSPPPATAPALAVEAPQLATASPFPDSIPHESDAVSAYRRIHRQRKERAKSVTLALIALIGLLSCVLVFVLWRQG